MTIKHFFVALVSLMLMTSAFAQDENRADDTALVSDETAWVDDIDTLTWENDSIERHRHPDLGERLDRSGQHRAGRPGNTGP